MVQNYSDFRELENEFWESINHIKENKIKIKKFQIPEFDRRKD